MASASLATTSNQVFLRGAFAGEPVVRELPSGDQLVSFRVTVVRPPGSRVRVDSIDCVSTRAAVRRTALRCTAGDPIEVSGSLHRRFWRSSGGGPASKYEVDVGTLTITKTRR